MNFGMGSFAYIVTRSIAKMMYEPRFTKINSHKKEVQVSDFLDERILVVLYVLEHRSNF